MHWEIVKKRSVDDKIIKIVKKFKANSSYNIKIRNKAIIYRNMRNKIRISKKYYYVIYFNPN